MTKLRRSLVSLLPLVALFALPGLPGGAAAAPADGDRDAERARRRTPVVEVFEASRDAVVSISSTEIVTVRGGSPFDSLFDDFFDMPRRRAFQQRRESVGSGFVIHPDGYIVTNAHVVARTTERKVIFADGREYEAEIVAADTARDIAVLKIEAEGSLPTLPLGRSDDLMVGETVVAIGNPLGYQHTVTAGVVSAVDRDLVFGQGLSFEGLIQTDASINPGNSGGPLLNVLGQLIGINTAIRGDAENIGFAIPVDQLRTLLPELLDVERRYRIISGLAVDSIAEPRVTFVLQDSPAARAGVRPGDVLLAIDGRPVREGIDYDIALIDRRPDDPVQLTLLRDDEQIDAVLRLEQRPAPDAATLIADKLGLRVMPLPEDVARELGLRRSRGLLVAAVEPDGPADEAAVRRYDILLAIGRHYVASPEDLAQLLEEAEPGTTAQVRVLRVERRRKVQRAGPIVIR